MPALNLHAEPLKDEWLDAYGHLNEAYYMVPFTNANWAILDHFGIGTAYFVIEPDRGGQTILDRLGRSMLTTGRHKSDARGETGPKKDTPCRRKSCLANLLAAAFWQAAQRAQLPR